MKHDLKHGFKEGNARIYIAYICDVTGQKEYNLRILKVYIIKKWIHAGKNTSYKLLQFTNISSNMLSAQAPI